MTKHFCYYLTKISSFVLLSFVAFAIINLTSCSSLQKQIDIRKQASKAKITLQGVKIKDIDFAISGLSVSIKSLDFLLDLAVKNDSVRDLVIDSFELSFLLDATPINKINNKAELLVKSGTTKMHELAVRLNTFPLKKLLQAKKIKVVGKVHFKIKLFDNLLSIPLTMTVNEEKDIATLKQQIKNKIPKATPKNILNRFFN